MIVILFFTHAHTQVELPEVDETFVQISTPVGRKRRRISGNTERNIARLSIIPLDRSFIIADEDDFEVNNIITQYMYEPAYK